MEINIDFSKPCQITKYLFENIGVKKSGNSFNDQDIEGYITRGYLPRSLGDVKIIDGHINMNIRVITLKGNLSKDY